ncbi:hypothetical protein U8527_19130 [Kordia algicida OT-1]|uniref:Uncharacterized protein n=1 Tax=Kordia algicida OT-1 TaxID=391587 RepID=A9DJK5_9FLAO|nr:hypothetical protein [Kordia algicida]EDP98121.1 hypothetical protein KAOT1_12927 [Kordia algicida OT-1]
MKKKKLITKLVLGKHRVSDLSKVNGGYIPPYDDTTDDGGGGSGGSGGTYSNNCSGQTCGNCITAFHPLTDPIHCRTCHTGC